MFAILFIPTGEYLYKEASSHALFSHEEFVGKTGIHSEVAYFKTNEEAEKVFTAKWFDDYRQGYSKYAYVKFNKEQISLLDTDSRSLFEIVEVD